jgi:inosose dehydratase
VQLDRDQVLGDMREIGLGATEFGPDGFLPVLPAHTVKLLAEFGLEAVGGFLPVVLHDAEVDPTPAFDDFARSCVDRGAGVVVLAAATGVDGYDERPELDEAGWTTLLQRLDALSARADDYGLVAVLHPHVGTMIENEDEVIRVLAGSRVDLCVDTGHLAACGADPVAITLAHLDRVRHVHLKDVDSAVATRLQSGVISFSQAIEEGLFVVLGAGDIDIRAMVSGLEQSGYAGWYVLEQDIKLSEPPAPGAADGPRAAVQASADFLKDLLR